MYDYDWFKKQAKKIGISLSDEQIRQFKLYADLLSTEKEKFNLTAADWERLIPDHFLDSLTVVLGWPLSDGTKLVDIGSGAGFPGIPLKIAFPEIKVALLESNLKRAKFLGGLIKKLNFNNAEVITKRAEVAGHHPNIREKNNFVTSRAVADLNVLLEYALPLLAVGGIFIALKGPKAVAEAEAAKPAARLLGGRVEAVIPVPYIPDKVRNLVLVKKEDTTPLKYPRRVGIPAKRPLKK